MDLLKSIGFEWDGEKYDELWMGMFQKLVVYKEMNKNTKVPQQYDEDPKLGTWVSTQRGNFRDDELLPKRLVLLNSIGFEWEVVRGRKVNNKIWMNMFHKLVEYNEQHKNTMVPRRVFKLGRWVYQQRLFYKRGELLPNRITLLKSIGFA